MLVPRLRLVAITAPLILLSACMDTPDSPQSSSTRVTSAATTAGSTPTPSRTGPLTTGPNVRPGEKPPDFNRDLHSHTSDAGFAMGRDFVRALDWSIATNDAYLLRTISSAGCQTCKRYMDHVDALRTHQQVLHGGRIRVDRLTDVTDDYRSTADRVLRARTIQDRAVVSDHNGETVSDEKATVETSLIYVVWTAAGWRVSEVAAA